MNKGGLIGIVAIILGLLLWGFIELHLWWFTPHRIRERERHYAAWRARLRRLVRRKR